MTLHAGLLTEVPILCRQILWHAQCTQWHQVQTKEAAEAGKQHRNRHQTNSTSLTAEDCTNAAPCPVFSDQCEKAV